MVTDKTGRKIRTRTRGEIGDTGGENSGEKWTARERARMAGEPQELKWIDCVSS